VSAVISTHVLMNYRLDQISESRFLQFPQFILIDPSEGSNQMESTESGFALYPSPGGCHGRGPGAERDVWTWPGTAASTRGAEITQGSLATETGATGS
jgi:hypothetical protein